MHRGITHFFTFPGSRRKKLSTLHVARLSAVDPGVTATKHANPEHAGDSGFILGYHVQVDENEGQPKLNFKKG